MKAHKYNLSNGEWLPGQEIEIKEGQVVPTGYTIKPLPQPCWRPVYVTDDWVETITTTELESIPPEVFPINETEKIAGLEEENSQMNLSIIELYEMALG